MDLGQYLEYAYRWIQSIYALAKTQRLIETLKGWISGLSSQELLKWLKTNILWILLVGLLIDAVLYWTRRDQTARVARVFYRIRSGWDWLLSRIRARHGA